MVSLVYCNFCKSKSLKCAHVPLSPLGLSGATVFAIWFDLIDSHTHCLIHEWSTIKHDAMFDVLEMSVRVGFVRLRVAEPYVPGRQRAEKGRDFYNTFDWYSENFHQVGTAEVSSFKPSGMRLRMHAHCVEIDDERQWCAMCDVQNQRSGKLGKSGKSRSWWAGYVCKPNP